MQSKSILPIMIMWHALRGFCYLKFISYPSRDFENLSISRGTVLAISDLCLCGSTSIESYFSFLLLTMVLCSLNLSLSICLMAVSSSNFAFRESKNMFEELWA